MILDNASSHDFGISSSQCYKRKPLDQGIVASFKIQYEKKLLRHLVFITI